jgi:hypothetical protein
VIDGAGDLGSPDAAAHFTLKDSQMGEVRGISVVAHLEGEAED